MLSPTKFKVKQKKKSFKDFLGWKCHLIDQYDALSIYNKGTAKIQTENLRSYPIWSKLKGSWNEIYHLFLNICATKQFQDHHLKESFDATICLTHISHGENKKPWKQWKSFIKPLWWFEKRSNKKVDHPIRKLQVAL